MERPNQRLTDAELIKRDIDAWAAEATPSISDTVARVIASRWHGGQASYLYSFQSTGAIDKSGLEQELAVLVVQDGLGDDDLNEIAALGQYLLDRDDRNAQPDWNRRMSWS